MRAKLAVFVAAATYLSAPSATAQTEPVLKYDANIYCADKVVKGSPPLKLPDGKPTVDMDITFLGERARFDGVESYMMFGKEGSSKQNIVRMIGQSGEVNRSEGKEVLLSPFSSELLELFKIHFLYMQQEAREVADKACRRYKYKGRAVIKLPISAAKQIEDGLIVLMELSASQADSKSRDKGVDKEKIVPPVPVPAVPPRPRLPAKGPFLDISF